MRILVTYPVALLSAAVTTAVSLPFWRRWSRQSGAIDEPGDRKIHSTPIPLAGGLAVMTGLAVPLLAGAAVAAVYSRFTIPGLFEYGLGKRALQIVGIMVGALGMLLIGLRDDLVELRPAIKFGAQLVVALMVAATGIRITLFVPSLAFSYGVTALWILTVVNAFNFMDNMNGLCTGIGAIGAASFGLIASSQGQYLVAAMAFLIAGALAGFLPYNFPRATAFLGDAGSHLTGFLLGVLAILPHFYSAKHRHPLAVLTPLLVLAVPLADLIWVVILRCKAGKPFYIGDTNHLSHRLVRRGLDPARAVLLIWLLSAAAGALAILLQ
ncbi:MAG TPA: MraY family glycosyltransferase [Candidatus Baltobacteraceae bacterium]|jgi:UDP-GlcNAc:undecaprenyl-phosphate GlcNAc-1-phosphate transferase|nr:MraY family glycosyltransferase [Candidatus Baltobacteraceae bacterium]